MQRTMFKDEKKKIKKKNEVNKEKAGKRDVQ